MDRLLRPASRALGVFAGTALMAAGRAADIGGGIELAREAVRSGAALAKLDQLIAFCRA